ncbi:MAG: archease [Candidatus Omnitrophota bacterium]
MKKYELIEHTADLAIRVYGPSLETLFINSAQAMFEQLINVLPPVEKKRNVFLQSDTNEDLLVYWLNELLSIFYTYYFIPRSYRIEISGKEIKTLQAAIEGNYCEVKEGCMKAEIKAATYHAIKIKHTNNHYEVDIIFDV